MERTSMSGIRILFNDHIHHFLSLFNVVGVVGRRYDDVVNTLRDTHIVAEVVVVVPAEVAHKTRIKAMIFQGYVSYIRRVW